MTENPNVMLGVGVDASGARQGFEGVKSGAKDMAQSVAQSGQQAGAGLDVVGDKSESAADRLDRSTKNIISSIQRSTAAIEAGSRGTSKYYEVIANQRGANVDALKPFLAELDAAIEKQNAAAASLGNMGVSAKQTAYAMRGIPAQFTDIVVSLQAGQAPMTVLLQQGGQLKDMFGGVGNAAKAMGSYVVGLINPYTVAAAAVGTLGVAYAMGAKEMQEYTKTLILTGNAAQTTAGQLSDISKSVAGKTGATTGSAASVLNELAATGKVTGEMMDKAAQAAIRLERAGGQAASETVKEFAALGDAPVAAVLKLDEKYHFLTGSVFAQVKALQEQGKETEAARVAQEALYEMYGIRIPALAGSLGTLEKAWKSVKDVAKGTWDAMLNVGRHKSLKDQLSDVQKDIATGSTEGNDFFSAAHLAALKEKEKYLVSAIQKEKSITEETIKQNKERAAGREFAQLEEKNLSKKVQMEREISAIREKAAEAKIEDQSRINALIEKVREKYKEKTGAGNNDAQQIFSAALAEEKDYAATQIALVKDRIAQGVINEANGAYEILEIHRAAFEKETSLVKKQIDKTKDVGDKAKLGQQLSAIANEAQKAESAYTTAIEKMRLAEQKKAEDDAYKWLQQRAKAEGDSATAIQKEADSIRQNTNELGLSKSAIEALRAARDEDIISMKERELAELDAQNQCTDYTEALRANIAALKSRKAALEDQSIKQASVDAAKASAEEWKKGWQETDHIARDSFTMWATEGGSAAKKIGETLKKALLSAIYEATLKPVVFQLYSSATNALGVGTPAASTIGTASSLGSLLSTGKSAYSLATGGYSSAYTGFAGSSIGQTLGLSEAAGAGYAAPVYDAAGALISAGSEGVAAGGLTGLGATIGAALPWVAGVLAVAAIAKKFIGSGGGVKTEGDYYGTLGASGTLTQSALTTGGAADWYTGSSANAQLAALAPALGQSIYNVVTKLGGNASGIGVNFGYNTDPNGKAQDNVAAGVTDAAGNFVYQRTYNVDKGGASAALQLEMQRMTLTAVKAAEGIQPIFKEIVNGIDLTTATAEQMTATLADVQNVVALRDAFDKLNLGADNLSTTLIKSAGGITALTTQLDSYYTNYFTAEEQKAKQTASLAQSFADLNLAMPTTREGFRNIVESLDLTSSTGQTTFNALMGLQAAFASVTDAATSSATTASAAAAAAATAAADARTAMGNSIVDSFTAQKAALEETIKKMDAFTTSILNFKDSIALGDSSILTPSEKLSVANAAFSATAQKAVTGDETAINALPDSITAMLTASKNAAGDSTAYSRDVARANFVLDAVSQYTSSISSDAQNQLDTLPARMAAFWAGVQEAYRSSGVPGYASGGDHSGGWRVVGEAGPELEYTSPSRIYSNQQSKSLMDLTGLVTELQGLRDDLRAGQAAIASNTNKTAKALSYVMQSGNALTVEVLS